MNNNLIVKSFLEFLTEAARIVPNDVLRFAVIAEGFLTFIYFLALILGFSLQQLIWFSIFLITLYSITLGFVYFSRRGVTLTKVKLEEKEQLREEVRALISGFWQIRDGELLLCAVSSLGQSQTLKYERPMTGFGEIIGYASIVYSLSRAYKQNSTKDAYLFFSEDFPQDRQHLERSLILLGGDDKNKVTKEMFKQFQLAECQLPFRFVYEWTERGEETGIKYLICGDEKNEEKFEPRVDPNRQEGELGGYRFIDDFGIVARLPNPLNPSYSKLFIFAGCHTFGTAAAAKVVSARSILKHIDQTCSYYQKSEFFVAVIHANMIGKMYFHIDRMEAFYPLDEALKVIPNGIKRNVGFPGSPDHDL